MEYSMQKLSQIRIVRRLQMLFTEILFIRIAKGATNYNQFVSDWNAVEQQLIPFSQTHSPSMELPSDAFRFESFFLCIVHILIDNNRTISAATISGVFKTHYSHYLLASTLLRLDVLLLTQPKVGKVTTKWRTWPNYFQIQINWFVLSNCEIY